MGLFSSSDLEKYEEECVSNYSACFRGPAGVFVLEDLWGLCGMDKSVFKEAGFDPVQAAFNDGMKYVVLRLLGYSGRKPFEI